MGSMVNRITGPVLYESKYTVQRFALPQVVKGLDLIGIGSS